jgi:hypothetical protein
VGVLQQGAQRVAPSRCRFIIADPLEGRPRFRGAPVVLDVSTFSKSAARRFMTDFAERLYRQNRQALHLTIDEAETPSSRSGSSTAPRGSSAPSTTSCGEGARRAGERSAFSRWRWRLIGSVRSHGST